MAMQALRKCLGQGGVWYQIPLVLTWLKCHSRALRRKWFLKQVAKYLIETLQRNKELDLCKEVDISARRCCGAG